MAHAALSWPEEEADASRTCTLWYVKRELASDYSDARFIRYVQKLVDERGFPRPMPALRGSQLVDCVCAQSRFLRAAVDNWLDDFLPPDAHDMADRKARAAAANDMDSAAFGLRLVKGGRA